ncbi:MAG TPA: hypothetical protein P5077_03200 [bacterium]|nr:hypothetical protein [bacterium]
MIRERIAEIPRPAGNSGPFFAAEWPHHLLLILVSGFIAFYKLSFGDLWTHLAQGRYILEHRTVPSTDVFSYTYFGKPWANWEWLHNLMTALCWEHLGPNGLILFRMLILCGIAVATYHLLRRILPAPLGALALTGLSLVLLQQRVADRPHFFSYLCLALLLLFLSRPRNAWRGPLIAAFVLLIVWRNSHPSWVLGLALLATGYGDTLLSSKDGSSRPSWRLPLLLSVAAIAIFLLTPIPIDLSAYLSLQSGEADLPEWRSLFFLGPALLSGYYILFFLFSAGLIAAAAIRFRECPCYTLLAVAVLANAYWHFRFIPEAVLLGMPLIAAALTRSPLPTPSPRRAVLWAILLCTLTAFAAEHFRDDFNRKRGLGIDDTMVPLHAADFMREHSLGGNVYGHYWISMDFLMGYLYPAVKVAVDIRVPGLYPYEFARRFWGIESLNAFRAEVAPLPVDLILLGHQETRTAGHMDRDLEKMLLDEGAELVYFDRSSALFRTPRMADRALRPFTVLTRWNTDASALERIAGDPALFARTVEELRMLKERTTGRDDFYREVLQGFYAKAPLGEEQRHALEELYGER